MRSHSVLHPCCCYLYFRPSNCRAELGCIYHRYYRESPMLAGPRGCGQFTGCEQQSQDPTLKSTAHNPSCCNGGYQTFHLLCISFLAVLLLEEARHWSHLTGTSAELFHLNYSSYMRAISFKGTDVSLLPLCCQVKGTMEGKNGRT